MKVLLLAEVTGKPSYAWEEGFSEPALLSYSGHTHEGVRTCLDALISKSAVCNLEE